MCVCVCARARSFAIINNTTAFVQPRLDWSHMHISGRRLADCMSVVVVNSTDVMIVHNWPFVDVCDSPYCYYTTLLHGAVPHVKLEVDSKENIINPFKSKYQ
jgi:hypothetical protein